MKTYHLPNTDLQVSRISLGCMGLGGSWDRKPLTDAQKKKAVAAITTALDAGVNFFDHADIYTMGKSEIVFSEMWQVNPGLRERIILQSKCGIRFPGDPSPHSPGRFDFSYAHIIHSLEGILERLKTDYLDVLLLHRPDPLVEPDEVARAFDELHAAGKVRYFGVSNHTPAQIELLRRSLNQPLVVNQVELNLLHNYMVTDGVFANQMVPVTGLGYSILDYCRLNDILVQAWSPVARGDLVKPPVGSPENIVAAARLAAQFAKEKGVSTEAILIAWLLRHPAGIQPVIGSTNAKRIQACCEGDEVDLNREEWYRLLVAAQGRPMP